MFLLPLETISFARTDSDPIIVHIVYGSQDRLVL